MIIKISIIFLGSQFLIVRALQWKDTITATIIICKFWKIKWIWHGNWYRNTVLKPYIIWQASNQYHKDDSPWASLEKWSHTHPLHIHRTPLSWRYACTIPMGEHGWYMPWSVGKDHVGQHCSDLCFLWNTGEIVHNKLGLYYIWF